MLATIKAIKDLQVYEKIEPSAQQDAKKDVVDLWEKVLGQRFLELTRNRQGAVIAAIGCDEAFSCPLVEAYSLSAVLGNWTAEESVAMQPYGVTFDTYKAFLAWNDSASEIEIHLCRTWLVAQMEGRA